MMAFDWGQNALTEPYYDALMGNPAAGGSDGGGSTTGLPEGWRIVEFGGKQILIDEDGEPVATSSAGGGGTAGPDFIAMAQLKLQEYLAQMSGQEGAADIAHKQWLTEIGNIRIELDRQTAEATRALGVQQEVTNRAKIFAQDILPGLLPVTQLDIKDLYGILGGPYQGMKLDIPAMFNQGTGGLGSVAPLPPVDLSGITPFPATKTIPAPDLSAFLQAAGGF